MTGVQTCALPICFPVTIWGTGGINVDGCRIEHNEPIKTTNRKPRSATWNMDTCGFDSTNNTIASADPNGRFPANIILDEEAGRLLDEQSGVSKSKKSMRGVGYTDSNVYGVGDKDFDTERGFNDSGGASRFFYCAKASKKERNAGLEEFPTKTTGMSNGAQIHGEGYDKGQSIGLNRVIPRKNHHPTVKPISLMRYLVRLITPPNGIVLDPFTGSGTTLIASKLEGFSFVGIEQAEEYCEIARQRVKQAQSQQNLFG